MNNVFWVGVYPGLSEEMIDYIAATLREAAETKCVVL
jgi:CDP-6-deoxy-D-xylo-4-hexulose-3-dehydrase